MNRIASIIITFFLISLFVISCGQKKTKEQLYAEAKRFERDEQFEDAIKTFEKLVKDYPEASNVDSVLFWIGQIQSNNLTDFNSSVKTHARLVKQCPESKLAAQSLFMIGYHYANSISDLDSAKVYYQKFVDLYPDNELVNSVKWELEHLGQDINEIDFLQTESPE
ncbi:tetratricopeptide repeat protein [candidate division KSB1 bacterium]|nr:tetratricopeptide repeat protein [candidate division KSB1 bacterium]MBL7092350.1 tetratricopeptide repeat protein [candidate division KSB1 bacterium]